jgi:hypothetical protein
MSEIKLTEAELEEIIVSAYQRGATWVYENPSAEDKPYVSKASLDYADVMIHGYKSAGLE